MDEMESHGRQLSSPDKMESVGVGRLADEVLLGYSSCRRRTGGSRSALRGPAQVKACDDWPSGANCSELIETKVAHPELSIRNEHL
jgi:hypothetical protein